MSRPAVYQFVRNKDDAFRRLVVRLLEGSLAAARTATAASGSLEERLSGALEAKLDLTLRLWDEAPAHAAELLAPTRLTAELLEGYNTAMLDLLTVTVSEANLRVDAPEFVELLLALTRGLEADLSDPDAPRRRLRHGVAMLVAALEPLDYKEPV